MIERGGSPPLIVTCQDWHYALVEARTWLTTPLGLESGRVAFHFVLSPDGVQLAAHVDLFDTHTGLLRTLIDGEQLSANSQLNYSGYDVIEPVAWSGTILYTHVEHIVTSTFWRTDTMQPSPAPQPPYSMGWLWPMYQYPNRSHRFHILDTPSLL